MNRALKIGGGIVAGVVVLPVVAVAVLLAVIDPNDFKPEIAQLVKDKTDMDLAINDRLEWALWPSLGVKLGKTTLTDSQAKETLLAVDRAAVSVQLMPLFAQQIAIDAVELDGAKVRFIQHADGTTSWDRMLTKLKSPEEEKSEKVAFNISKLDIRNTELFLADEASKTTRTVSKIAVQSQDIDLDQAFPVAAQFEFSQQDGAGKTLLAKNDIKTTVQLFQDEERYVITGLELASDLSGSLLPAPATVKLAGDITADLKQQLHTVDKLLLAVEYRDPALASPATLALKGAVKADMAKQQISVNGLSLDASYPDKALSSPATLALSGAVLADLGQSLATVQGLKLKAAYPQAGLKSPITADLNTDLSAQWADGNLSLPNLVLNAVYPDAKAAKPIAVNLNAALKANWLKGEASLPAFTARALGVEAKGQLAARLPAVAADAQPGTPLLSGLSLNGALATNTFNAKSVLAALGIAAPKTQDPKALQAVSLSTDIAGSENSLLLKSLRLKLDGSSLSGEAGISDLKTMRQYARLSLDKINVDGYLPPATAAAKAEGKPAAKPASPAGLLPVELLRQQNMDVAINVGSLQAMGYSVAGLKLAATAGKGLLNVSEFKGDVYQGSFSVPASINVQGAQPVLNLKPNINQIELGPLLKTVLKQDFLTGKASYNGELKLTGNSTDAWLQSVDGMSGLKLTDGLLHGVNMTQLVMDELGKYQALLPLLTGRDAATIVKKQNDTVLKAMALEATLNNGVLQGKDFNADIQQAKLAGGGSFNLLTQEMDYSFKLSLDKSLVGEKYAAYPIPLRCKGSLKGGLARLCGVDAGEVKTMALKVAADKQLEKLGVKGGDVNVAVQQKVEEEKKKAQDKLNQKLGEGLNKLFNR